MYIDTFRTQAGVVSYFIFACSTVLAWHRITLKNLLLTNDSFVAKGITIIYIVSIYIYCRKIITTSKYFIIYIFPLKTGFVFYNISTFY
jgi:hypothetical protein